MGNKKNIKSKYSEYLIELLEIIEDTLHKRIIKAFDDEDPVRSMEAELGKALLEMLGNED